MNITIRNGIIVLILTQILLYEWGIFELSDLSIIANFLKIAIPLALIILAGYITGFNVHKRLEIYIVTFFLFALYTVIPTALSENASESVLQYLKLIPPRLCFIIGVSALFTKDPSLIKTVNKALVYIAVFTFIQYFFAIYYVNLHPFEDTNVTSDRGSAFAGPFGLYGNIVTEFKLPTFQAVRLTGFWLEPSNASGFLFSVYFLALSLRKDNSVRLSNFLCSVPLIAGFFALSSAGYIAFAAGYLGYLFLSRSQSKSQMVGLVAISVIMPAVIFGRFIYLEYFPDDENMVLRAILGVRDTSTQSDDFTGGRIKNYYDNIKVILENPLGIGFRIPGEDASGKGFADTSASAVFYLATFTGVIGLMMMLFMKSIVFMNILRVNRRELVENSGKIFLLCAWLVISVQNIVYGTWLSFYYFYISIATIVSFASINPKLIKR